MQLLTPVSSACGLRALYLPCIIAAIATVLQMQAQAVALCAFRVEAEDSLEHPPAPLIGTLGRTGGHGSEVNVCHRLWSSTNRHQASWAYVTEGYIQSMANDYFDLL
jgi:hypothetical protein